jgi:hypothetical protein
MTWVGGVGIAGSFVYSFIIIYSIICYAFWRHSLTTVVVYFYILMTLMGIVNLPLFLEMAIIGDKVCIECKAVAFFSDFFYFSCLSLVSYVFVDLFYIDPLVKFFYKESNLKLSVFLQFITSCISFVVSLTSVSIEVYFASDYFMVLVLITIIQGLIYECLLGYYGMSMLHRFRNLTIEGLSSEEKENYERQLFVKLDIPLYCLGFFICLRILLLTSIVIFRNNSVRKIYS